MGSSTDYLYTLHITDYLVLHSLILIRNLVRARRIRLHCHLFTHCISPLLKNYLCQQTRYDILGYFVRIRPLKDIMLYFTELDFLAFQMEFPEMNAWLCHGLGDSHQYHH